MLITMGQLYFADNETFFMVHLWLLNKKSNKIKQATYHKKINIRNMKHLKEGLTKIQVWCSVMC